MSRRVRIGLAAVTIAVAVTLGALFPFFPSFAQAWRDYALWPLGLLTGYAFGRRDRPGPA